MSDTFKCGHPRSEANNAPNGYGRDGKTRKFRCRICLKATYRSRGERNLKAREQALLLAKPKPKPTLEDLPTFMPLSERAIRATAIKSGVSYGDLISGRRWRRLVRGRWVVMSVMHAAGFSLPIIARTLRLKDHTTVMHGLRVAPEWMARDARFAAIHSDVMEYCRPWIESGAIARGRLAA